MANGRTVTIEKGIGPGIVSVSLEVGDLKHTIGHIDDQGRFWVDVNSSIDFYPDELEVIAKKCTIIRDTIKNLFARL